MRPSPRGLQAGQALPATRVAGALLRRWKSGRRARGSRLVARVHHVLKESILSRELLPGDVISEREIERIFRVSRNPVREALKLLEAQGWITTRPRGGTRIRGLAQRDVCEIFQLRECLEPMAARLAAGRMTASQDAWFKRVLTAMTRNVKRGAVDDFIRQDLTVHTRIARLSGNARLEAIIVGLGENIRRLGTHSIALQGRPEVSLREHAALFRMLRDRNPRGSARCMLVHVVNTRRSVLRRLRVLQGETGGGGRAGTVARRRPLRYRGTARYPSKAISRGGDA